MNLSQNSENILEVSNVSFGYDERNIISNINLTLRENELISLLGVSGSGKSTLFNIISGLLKPNNGQVIYRGKDITGKTGLISYSFQKDLLLPYMTIEENVSLPLLIKKEKKTDAIKKANETGCLCLKISKRAVRWYETKDCTYQNISFFKGCIFVR